MKLNNMYLLLLWLVFPAQAEVSMEDKDIPFTAEFWDLAKAKVEQIDGRQAITGSAVLTQPLFDKGIMEVSIKTNGTRSFPGIAFRSDSAGNSEDIYLRPHLSGQADAIQYAPTYNQQTAWQLYYGDGYTAKLDIPTNRWIKFIIEVSGSQARVFVDNLNSPALSVTLLKGKSSPGKIVVSSGGDGVYMANFRLKKMSNVNFTDAPPEKIVEGTLQKWSLSKAISVDDPASKNLSLLHSSEWQAVEPEASGLVNVSRYRALVNGNPSVVYARTIIKSEKKQRIKLEFGYSDDVTIFQNRRPLYSGRAGFKSREPQFKGLVDYNDAIYINLNSGDNEIILQLTEVFGGWGFKMRSLPE
ncbi:MAG: hypothetical protein V4660_20675 [Pseudomonadota bacterium]